MTDPTPSDDAGPQRENSRGTSGEIKRVRMSNDELAAETRRIIDEAINRNVLHEVVIVVILMSLAVVGIFRLVSGAADRRWELSASGSSCAFAVGWPVTRLFGMWKFNDLRNNILRDREAVVSLLSFWSEGEANYSYRQTMTAFILIDGDLVGNGPIKIGQKTELKEIPAHRFDTNCLIELRISVEGIEDQYYGSNMLSFEHADNSTGTIEFKARGKSLKQSNFFWNSGSTNRV